MTVPYSQQHLLHPKGGTWCGADVANDPGVADVRPRVPVCADCHIKAMHYRADLLTEVRAEVDQLMQLAGQITTIARSIKSKEYKP